MLDNSLLIYRDLLIKWSKTINLVAPSTLNDIKARHFDDSLQLLKYIPAEAKFLLDIGSGAGFPALVIAMAQPDLKVALVESDTRKCSFLSTVSRETKLNTEVINARIENLNLENVPDVITARALADLSLLLKMTEKFWQQNDKIICVFPKGVKWRDEITDAKSKYDFDCENYQSLTDKDAAVLVIKNIKHKNNS